MGYRHTPHLALDDAPAAHSIRTTTAKGCASLARRGLLVRDGSVPGHYGIAAAGMALAQGAVPEGTALAPWLWLLRHLPIRRSHALDEGADPTTLPLLPGWSRTLGWSSAGDADGPP